LKWKKASNRGIIDQRPRRSVGPYAPLFLYQNDDGFAFPDDLRTTLELLLMKLNANQGAKYPPARLRPGNMAPGLHPRPIRRRPR
jgi:hypothetical protein